MAELTSRYEAESLDEYLWRLGNLKINKQVSMTWPDLCAIMNEESGTDHDESYWRKRHKKLAALAEPQDLPIYADSSFNEDVIAAAVETEKQKALIREQRTAFNKEIRNRAKIEDMFGLLRNEIQKASAEDLSVFYPSVTVQDDERTVYAMLSDIHYGLTFNNRYSEYNVNIAKKRVMHYAKQIADIGSVEGCTKCYVSLMGDMISGNIHKTIQLENRENIVGQIVGASELTASFISYLAKFFHEVHVNSVSGNHSRVENDADAALRGEKLDAVIPWYCKARLSNYPNVIFEDNYYDESFGMFSIYGKNYVSVHGDMDNDLRLSAMRIGELIGKKIDYVLAGHLHVADCRLEKTGYIRNGAVLSGGDDYTAKKRLFGPATQVCLVVSERGVESIHPVMLD